MAIKLADQSQNENPENNGVITDPFTDKAPLQHDDYYGQFLGRRGVVETYMIVNDGYLSPDEIEKKFYDSEVDGLLGRGIIGYNGIRGENTPLCEPPVEIKYTFNLIPQYVPDAIPLTSEHQETIKGILSSYEMYTNNTFSELDQSTDPSQANWYFYGLNKSPEQVGYCGAAKLPGYNYQQSSHFPVHELCGTVDNIISGTFGYYASMHEIVHMLGPLHPSGVSTTDNINQLVSIMTTNHEDYSSFAKSGETLYPRTPMPLDIAAITFLNGPSIASMTDDTYTPDGMKKLHTIADFGGYDVMHALENMYLDIRPGVDNEQGIFFPPKKPSQYKDEYFYLAYGSFIEEVDMHGAEVIGHSYGSEFIAVEGNNNVDGGFNINGVPDTLVIEGGHTEAKNIEQIVVDDIVVRGKLDSTNKENTYTLTISKDNYTVKLDVDYDSANSTLKITTANGATTTLPYVEGQYGIYITTPLPDNNAELDNFIYLPLISNMPAYDDLAVKYPDTFIPWLGRNNEKCNGTPPGSVTIRQK